MTSANILHRVRKAIRDYRMILPGERILAAFSGGADSTFLVLSLLDLMDELEFSLVLAHFNHGLRPGAEMDESFARKAAEGWGLPIVVGGDDVRAYALRQRLNLEEAGRVLRYRFLVTEGKKVKAEKIATGHTLNDQAETLLMRLARGAGLGGMSGIFPVLDGGIIRPLLWVEKGEILQYLSDEGIGFREDPTNRDQRFLRNRVRHMLLPYLQQSFDEGILGRLGRTANLLQDDERLLRDLAAARLARLSPEKGILDVRPLEYVERALARRVVREFLRQEGGGLRGITQMDIDRILDMKEGKILRLAGRRRIGKERGLIRLYGERLALKKPEFSFLWDTLSPLKIAAADLLITAEILNHAPADRDYDDESKVFIDRDVLEFPLTVRNLNPGDRYIPLGAPGHIKLKEAFRSRDVPPSRRLSRPVFLSENEIIWVKGLPVGDKFKIGPGTRCILHIRTEPLCRS